MISLVNMFVSKMLKFHNTCSFLHSKILYFIGSFTDRWLYGFLCMDYVYVCECYLVIKTSVRWRAL